MFSPEPASLVPGYLDVGSRWMKQDVLVAIAVRMVALLIALKSIGMIVQQA